MLRKATNFIVLAALAIGICAAARTYAEPRPIDEAVASIISPSLP